MVLACVNARAPGVDLPENRVFRRRPGNDSAGMEVLAPLRNVRPWAWAFAISAAFHGAAVAWQLQRSPQHTERLQVVAPVTAAKSAPQPAEPEPMTVALLSDDTVASATRTMSHQRHTPPTGVSRPAIATRSSTTHDGNATTILTPAAPQEPPPLQRNPLMTMRGQRPLDTRLSANTPIISDDAAWGTAVDPNNPKWIENASPAQVHAALAERVARREAENHKLLRPDGGGTSKIERQPFRIKVAADGTVKIRDKANWQQKSLFYAEFDVTDGLMRKQGIDPYASEKMKLLDATREERVEIGKRYHTQQLARSAELARNNVVRLWSMTADVRERKQGLFELWDDCAEESTSDGSAELAAGGEAARRYLIGFIRSKLPAGSRDAFTPTEIAQLNGQRRSRSRFVPY
jgi:hypothetical protein